MNIVLVEVTRGNAVESRHCGAAAVVDARGQRIATWGDVDRPIFPRSAVKPVQALPLIETGAADHFGLSTSELALACASHSGEPEHVAIVASWLSRIGMTPHDLECGVHQPYGDDAAAALTRAGAMPTTLHNNCSGKHAGFLTTARHLGEPVAGYSRLGHPVQRRVLDTLEAMSGCPLAEMPRGIDGCGIPVIGMPLTALATAMARLATPAELPPARAAAARRILDAMLRHPYLVAGRHRFDKHATAAGRGTFVVKMGAEGVHVAAVPARGLGIAVKIDDGARRAAEVAMAAILRELGLLDAAALVALRPWLEAPIHDCHGREIGMVQPAPGWLNGGQQKNPVKLMPNGLHSKNNQSKSIA